MTTDRERRIQRGYAFALTPRTTRPGERCPACRKKNRTGVVGCPTANNCERGDVVAPMRRVLTELAEARKPSDDAEQFALWGIERGVADGEAYRAAANALRDGWLLDRCRCPQCGNLMERLEDERQTGTAEVPGTWFKYRHTEKKPGAVMNKLAVASGSPGGPVPPDVCKYLVDRKEQP